MTLSRLPQTGFSRVLSAFLAFVILVTAVPVAVLVSPRQALATQVLTNGAFTGNINNWVTTETTNAANGAIAYQPAIFNTAAGSLEASETAATRNASYGAVATQTVSGSITAGSTVLLSLWWRKIVTANITGDNVDVFVDIRKPSGTVVTIWQDLTDVTTAGTAITGTVTGQDVSSYFDETGIYEVRLRFSLTNGNSTSSRAAEEFDDVVLDVTAPAAATTTVGDAAPGPSSKSVARSDSSQTVDAFTLKTSSGSDSVATMTVTGANVSGNVPTNGVGIYQDNGTTPNAWDSGDTFKSKGSFSASTSTISFSPALSVTTADTTYIVTYNIDPAATNGAALTGYVSSITSSNTVSYLDNTDATLTVDATAPGTVTGFNAADGENAQSTLSWTNPGDGDLAEVKVMRKTGSYPTSNTDGTAVFDDTSSPFGTGYVDSPLTNGTTYYYAVFTKDAVGNWNNTVTAGVTADTGTPNIVTVSDGVSPANKTVGPSYTNQAVAEFTLKDSSATNSVTTATVTGTNTANVAASGVKVYQDNGTVAHEWDAGDTLKGTASFSGSTATVGFSPALSVGTADTTYIITYDLVAAPTHGQTLTGYISSAIASSYTVVDNDNADAVLTIDSSPPAIPTGFVATDGENAQSSLSWTNPGDSDLAEVKVVRKTGSYPTSNTDGTAVFDDTSSPFGASYVDNSPPLTNGTTYYYAVFVKDTYANWSSTVTPGTNADTAVPGTVPNTTVGNGVDPPSKSVARGNTTNTVDSFTLQTNTGSDNVTTVTVTGSADTTPGNVSLAKLYNDNNSNGLLDAGDTTVATTTFSGNTAKFTGLSLSATTTIKYYVIAYNVTATATNGAALTGTVTSITAGNPVTYNDTGSATLTVDVPLQVVTVSSINQAPRASAQPLVERDVTMQKLTLVTNSLTATWTAISVTKLGSLGDASATVSIFKSTDANLDTNDTSIGVANITSGVANITLTVGEVLSTSVNYNYFIVFRLKTSAMVNSWFASNLVNQSAVTVTSPYTVGTFSNLGSKEVTIIGEPHGSPGNPGAFTNTQYCSVCHTVHVAKQSRRMLNRLFTFEPAVVNTTDSAVYNDLCFSCHDGSGSTKNIYAQYYNGGVNAGHQTDFAGDPAKAANGYPKTTEFPSGVTYNGGVRMPCMICHDVHQSRYGNPMMMSDALYEFASSPSEDTGTGAWDQSLTLWQSSQETSASVKRQRCIVCHRSDLANANTDNHSIIVGIDMYRPNSHNTDPDRADGTGKACIDSNCHQLPHSPTAGESSGGQNCVSCHSNIVTPMNSTTTAYHHYIQNSDASPNVDASMGGGGKYPNDSQPTTESTQRRCLMCHADHDVFSPVNRSGAQRGSNLRTDINLIPSRTDGANSTNTDFLPTATNRGICTSCHQLQQTKNTTKQKSDGTTVTPVIDSTDFVISSHQYTATTTFSDSSIEKPNCNKCHNAMNSGKWDNSKQTSAGTRFDLHDGWFRRLLSYLGITPEPQPTADPLEQDFCFGCHSTDINPNAAAGKDYYNAASMGTTATAIKGVFTGKTYTHPVTDASMKGRHAPVEGQTSNWNPASSRHVECEDCHNPHAAKAGTHTEGGSAVGNAQLGVWGVTPSYTFYNTGTATFASASTAVTGAGTTWTSGMVGSYIKNNWDMAGRWYRITAVPTATSITLASAYDASFSSPSGQSRLSAIDYTIASATFTRVSEASDQYEICLKCHSAYAYNDTATNTPSNHANGSAVRETDISLDFNTNNMAIHPVTALGKNQPGRGDQTEMGGPANNWPLYTAGTVSVTTGSTTVTGTSTSWKNMSGGKSTIRPGWLIKVLTDAAGGPFSTGWFQVNEVLSDTTMTITTAYNGANSGSGRTYKLGAGLGNAFVPPWGPWSRMVCSDCHGSDSAGDPEGPHGSAAKWILKQADPNLSFDWYNGSTIQTLTPNSYAVGTGTSASATAAIFCYNCHRRDVYGDVNLSASDADNPNTTLNPDSALSRIKHDPTNNSNTFASANVNKWGIVCMNCHGGAALGGLHGTSTKFTGTLGTSNRGERFLNGASWQGVTRATTTTNVQCWVYSAASDVVSSCAHSHAPGTTGSDVANYNWP